MVAAATPHTLIIPVIGNAVPLCNAPTSAETMPAMVNCRVPISAEATPAWCPCPASAQAEELGNTNASSAIHMNSGTSSGHKTGGSNSATADSADRKSGVEGKSEDQR